jgi:hypothetical protein
MKRKSSTPSVKTKGTPKARQTSPAKTSLAAKAKTAAAGKVALSKSNPVVPAAGQAPSRPGDTGSAQILRELKELRRHLAPPPVPARSAEAALERGVDSMRRLLSELIEQHDQWILSRLIAIRAAAGRAPKAVQAVDQLLEDLGAIRFRAESFDHVDPLVHSVVEERPSATATEGVILETLQPGFRTGTGAVLAKANVAVSRKY